MDLRKDIYFYADLASFPASGAANLLYVDSATSLIYIWNGASYVASGAGGLKYGGLWNANTNNPTITSGVGDTGEYYIVGTAGTTSIDGISDWEIGDWIIFGGSAWQKIDNSEVTVATIYTADGTLTGDRTVSLLGNDLTFADNGTGRFTVNSDDGTNAVTIDASNSAGVSLSASSSGGAGSVNITTSGVNINGLYNLPQISGSTGQVLTRTSGSNTTWASAAGGLTYFTEAQNTAAPNATVPVNSLTPVTGTTNADVAIVPKGNGAFMLDIPDNTTAGGNKRGTNAVDLQTVRGNAAQVASGSGSFVAGSNNIASNSNSVALGDSNTASGLLSYVQGNFSSATGSYSYSVGYLSAASSSFSYAIGRTATASNESYAFGWNVTASGQYSTALGAHTVASGVVSTAMGYYSSTLGIYGRQTYASGAEAVVGDSQASKFILRERTTSNTATTLTTDSGAASTTNQVILSNQSAYRFKGSIVGKQSGSVNASVWDIDGFIVRGANAAATTLNVSNVTLVQNTPAWGTPSLAADTTNGGLRVQVTGAAATNIQWTCTIETTEVIYA